MLGAAAEGRFPQPEWAVRLPVLLLAVGALYLVYRATARAFGTRAGFLGGLVLLTAPYWFFLAHQSMTDMPYVAPLTAAVAFVLLGLGTEPEQRVTSRPVRIGKRVFALQVALVGIVGPVPKPRVQILV